MAARRITRTLRTSCDPAQISLVEGGSIIDACFRVGNEWQRVIVKRFHGDASNVVGFLTTHERLIKVNPNIATFTPQFLGRREGDLWIAMQFIPGDRHGTGGGSRLQPALEQRGATLRRVHIDPLPRTQRPW